MTVSCFVNWGGGTNPLPEIMWGCKYIVFCMIVRIRCRMLHVFITSLIGSPCRRYWRASRALSWAGAQSHSTTSLATTCRQHQQQQQPFKHKVSICSLPLWLCGSREQRLARPVLVQLGFWPQGLHQRWPQTFPTGPALPQGTIHLGRVADDTTRTTRGSLWRHCLPNGSAALPVQWVAWMVWISLHRPGGSCKMSCDTRQPPGGCCMEPAGCLSPRRTLPGWATLPKTPSTSP